MPSNYSKIALGNEVQEAAYALQIFHRSKDLRTSIRIRRETNSIEEEGNLQNTNLAYTILGFSLDSGAECLGLVIPNYITNPNHYLSDNLDNSSVTSKIILQGHIPLWLCGDKNVIGSDSLLEIPSQHFSVSLKVMMDIAQLSQQQPTSNEFTVNQFYSSVHMDR
ncbi:unnamed protein product [Meganyctiphanes norvegica]|uniref:Uncharacterized protein n=1 Tax=Meganyctiphanes norvegica TaxID=48144 RepID=A0AAV2PY69_MEGNR